MEWNLERSVERSVERNVQKNAKECAKNCILFISHSVLIIYTVLAPVPVFQVHS